ncbi:hypothetical protein [Pseudomonas serbica]|uniref:hypothetical protein n=1 Tax=Pseudomonas serbica TaxID=2965074 RepID=UPI00237AE635|nr:hypothetical protein [Pseudomonas serbica]
MKVAPAPAQTAVRGKLYTLRNAKGEYYSFADQANYDGPQLSRDPRNAKQMTAQGCGAVKRWLANPKYHGVEFERVAVIDMITSGLLPQPV